MYENNIQLGMYQYIARQHYLCMYKFLHMYVHINTYVDACQHRGNTEGARGANAPSIFFIPRNKFLAMELKRGK